MIRKILKLFKRRRGGLIDLDEVLLDSQNLPDFDTQQFEGQLEHPISRKSLFAVGIFFVLFVILFSGRLWSLQVAHGEVYLEQSKNNSLAREPLFAARGNIYDRNGVRLAYNGDVTDEEPWGRRLYIDRVGFSHVLGYVGYPARDKDGHYWKLEITGRDGIERAYEEVLQGKNGSKIIERDISGEVQGGSIVNQPIPGENLTLSLDARLQQKMSELLTSYKKTGDFRSGSAIVMDVHTGDIIVMTSVPEYDSNVISLGKDVSKIRYYLNDKSTPLLNRAVSGLFTPGSIVKPYIALEALNKDVITASKLICSCGSISIPNPYDPSNPSVFRDFNPNNGWVDMKRALAVSSNIYFYEVGGGFEGQEGIGIAGIGEALARFGLTEKTGVDLLGEQTGFIPSPDWKSERFNGEIWRIGDTYNTAIGQYGVQVTPISMARSVAALATGGKLVTPKLNAYKAPEVTRVDGIDQNAFSVVQEGMRLGAQEGTGRILSTLPFSTASKTGTAQVGARGELINTWMNMYFPYESPAYAVVVVFERGTREGINASQRATRDFLQWVNDTAPEYIYE